MRQYTERDRQRWREYSRAHKVQRNAFAKSYRGGYYQRNKEAVKSRTYANKAEWRELSNELNMTQIDVKHEFKRLIFITAIHINNQETPAVNSLYSYDSIRLNILKGISTHTLPKHIQDKWWKELQSRVTIKYGHELKDRNTHTERYSSGFFN